MGRPVLEAVHIPVDAPVSPVVAAPIEVAGIRFEMTCVSMGNPHAIMFVEDTATFPVEEIGRAFEFHPVFPERVNAEFVQVLDRNEVNMRVWERGSGETLACGTGACASVAAAVKNGYCKKDVPVTVSLLGGDLRIIYSDHCVMMEGPAKTVFEGVCDLDKV
jgi:diaminopimelate epimerase